MLVIRLDYNQYVVDENALPFIRFMTKVEEKRVGSITKYYEKKENEELEIKLVDNCNFVAKDDEESKNKDAQVMLKEEKERSDRLSKYWNEEQNKSKALKAELDAMKALCPNSHKENSDKGEF